MIPLTDEQEMTRQAILRRVQRDIANSEALVEVYERLSQQKEEDGLTPFSFDMDATKAGLKKLRLAEAHLLALSPVGAMRQADGKADGDTYSSPASAVPDQSTTKRAEPANQTV